VSATPGASAPTALSTAPPATATTAQELPETAAPILAELPAGSLRKAWTVKTQVWNRAVVIAPFGDVVSLGAREIQVHARDTGKVIESGQTCFSRSRHAFAFTSPGRAVLACTQRLEQIDFPGLTTSTVTEVGGRVTAAAASASWVASGLRGGEVRVLHADGGNEAERFSVPADVEDFAWSSDGVLLAMGLVDGRSYLRDRRATTLRELLHGNRRASGLAFSRDDAELFLHDTTFEARVVDPRKGQILRSYKVGPWVSTAESIGPGLFAAGGSDGLVLYGADDKEGKVIPWDDSGRSPSVEGLDVSDDGSLLCAGDRSGEITCYSTRPLTASDYRPKRSGEP